MKIEINGRYSANNEEFNKVNLVEVEEDNGDPTPVWYVRQGNKTIMLDSMGVHELLRALQFFDKY